MLEESASIHELRIAKEELLVLRKHVQTVQLERVADGEQHRLELQVPAPLPNCLPCLPSSSRLDPQLH